MDGARGAYKTFQGLIFSICHHGNFCGHIKSKYNIQQTPLVNFKTKNVIPLVYLQFFVTVVSILNLK